MKRNAVKSFSAVILVLILMFTTTCTSYAETLQDNIEAWINGIVDDYNSAETEEEKASLQEQLNAFLEKNGLDDVDLSGITDSDIGNIVSGFTDGSAFGDLFGLASDAWSSGIAMIQDVFNKGSGTSDGSNTATTNPKVTSPNVIIADTTKAEASTQAVGIGITNTTTAPAEITTYDVGATTAPAPVGPGVTTTVAATNAVVADDGVPASSVVVFAVLALATLAVIIAIVVFFVLKHK